MTQMCIFIFLVLFGGGLPVVHAISGTPREVSFEWEEVPQATQYELEFSQKEKNKKTKFIVLKAFWKGRLPVGKYLLRMRSFDYRKVPGVWSPPEEFQVLLPSVQIISPAPNAVIIPDDGEKEVEFKWTPVDGAHEYLYELKSEKKQIQKQVDGQSVSFSLPIGQSYEWSVRALSSEGFAGEAHSPQYFKIEGEKLQAPVIEKPESEYVRYLSWEAPRGAQKYSYIFLQWDSSLNKWKKQNSWKEISGNEAPFPSDNPGGKYRIMLQAHGEGYRSSNIATYEFVAKDGDRSESAENRDRIRESLNTHRKWYFIASYLISQVNYFSLNRDQGVSSKFNALSGTGRLGLGYYNEPNPWGIVLLGDYSGIIINNSNYTFASMETYATYNWNFQEHGEVRCGLGVFTKSLPEIRNSAGLTAVENLSTQGPMGVFEYWRPINSILGFQLVANLYLNSMGSTPNGKSLIPTSSYLLGVRGSYRLSSRLTGLMGYAYRKDQIQYEVSDPDLFIGSTKNETSMDGHFLNFYLEWDF